MSIYDSTFVFGGKVILVGRKERGATGGSLSNPALVRIKFFPSPIATINNPVTLSRPHGITGQEITGGNAPLYTNSFGDGRRKGKKSGRKKKVDPRMRSTCEELASCAGRFFVLESRNVFFEGHFWPTASGAGRRPSV
jgi:hypothetical protein